MAAGIEKHRRIEICANVSSIPLWSWGLTRRCCDIYPHHIGNFHNEHRFESGSLQDTHYFAKKEIVNNSVIYVASVDFPVFLNSFVALPLSMRLVLVTGLEDIGVPYELFHSSREEWKIIWKGRKTALSMRQFLKDTRLVRWYTQNYDLIGCNAFSCSDVSPTEASHIYTSKVVPIPIGMDFHTEAGKGSVLAERRSMENNRGVCAQRRDLEATVSSLPPFPKRPNRILVSFTCNLQWYHQATRVEICRLLQDNGVELGSKDAATARAAPTRSGLSNQAAGLITVANSNDKRQFWRDTGNHAFVFTPAGHGVDTHRLWEVLNLHSVPIVLSSPLDRLYAQFPVVIVKDWKDAFVSGALDRFRADIASRFGEDPFSSEAVRRKLKAKYWADVIRSEIHNKR